MAGTDPFKTSLVGFCVGIAKFMVPFYVIYRPEIMLVFGSPLKAVIALIMSFFGIWVLAGGIQNLPWNIAAIVVIILVTLYFRISAKKQIQKAETVSV